jgi:hypothetical protein
MNETQIAAHISTTPPVCVRAFRLSAEKLSEPVADNFKTVWHLTCKCNTDTGKLLGYPLRELKHDYAGRVFVSPLAFECASCGQVTEILDTDVHGYHAEVAKIEGGIGSSKIRGKGTRKAFACPDCTKDLFRINVGFVYWDFDLMLDEPDLPGEDFFNEFLMDCTCLGCGRVYEPTEFGKL